MHEAACVNPEVEGTDEDAYGSDDPVGQIGIEDGIEIVHEEAAVICGHAGAGLEVLLAYGERAADGSHFHDDSPDERCEVQAGPDGPPARECRANNDGGYP